MRPGEPQSWHFQRAGLERDRDASTSMSFRRSLVTAKYSGRVKISRFAGNDRADGHASKEE